MKTFVLDQKIIHTYEVWDHTNKKDIQVQKSGFIKSYYFDWTNPLKSKVYTVQFEDGTTQNFTNKANPEMKNCIAFDISEIN